MKNRIDETDAKILKTLLKESRTSFTEIAKDCQISVGAVRMRYKRLWKTGIINGAIMQVNPHSLGYKCISTIGITTAIENEKKVMKFLKSKPYISKIIETYGNNMGVIVVLYSIQELRGIIEDLESNPLIKHVDSLIWTKAASMDHTENLIIKPFTNKNEQKATQRPATINFKETKIDKTDRQIAKIFSQNSRISFRKVAEKLGISTKNVIQRYKKLRGRVLTLSTITVDLNKLGYCAMASLFIKIANRSKMAEIYDQMLQIPNLIVAIGHIGSYDLFAIATLKDFEELFKITEQIHRIKGIEQTDTFVRPTFPAWPLNLFASLL